MSYTGKIQLTLVVTAGPDQVAEGDRLFKTHLPWMKSSHPKDGDKALLSYTVSKAIEMGNPMDPSSSPTGNTQFILTEVYASPAGVSNHFELAENSWDDFPAFMTWLGNCKFTMVPVAEIGNSLW